MNWFVLIGLIVCLFLAGCNLDELQGKHKITTNNYCYEIREIENSELGQKGADFLAGGYCMIECGSSENYSSWNCPGNYLTCYCEKDSETITK